ncbi:MAG: transposase [Desulfobacterales bacterium]|nr:transposase [Desulfobacterales bacterium]
MARKLRVEYAGAIYHVMNRGDRREPIFQDEDDRQRFVATLGEVCVRSGWRVHAYCLMPNHFHLVVETPTPTLVDRPAIANGQRGACEHAAVSMAAGETQ